MSNTKTLLELRTESRQRADQENSEFISDAELTAIVPVKTMQLVERVLNDPEEMVQVGFLDNQISIGTSTVQVTSNLVQGRFPKYEDVIPSSYEKRVRLETELLRRGVRRVALLTNEQSRGILMTYTTGELCLTSSTPEAGEAEIKMPAEYEGEELKIGFNPQYILDVLRVVDESEIFCEMSDAAKPGVLRAGKDFLYVIMPVSV